LFKRADKRLDIVQTHYEPRGAGLLEVRLRPWRHEFIALILDSIGGLKMILELYWSKKYENLPLNIIW
jgi:hypothetical protein